MFITGSGPGTGKTTIASLLHAEFEARGLPVRCWYETEVLQETAFHPFYALFKQAHPQMIDALKKALSEFLDSNPINGASFISESLIPFVRWLVEGDLPPADIKNYCRWLNTQLVDHQPRLLVLICRLEEGLARARQDRGSEWIQQWKSREKGYPLYKRRPGTDRWFVFEREREYLEYLDWPITEFDTHRLKPEQIVNTVIDGLELPAKANTPPPVMPPGIYTTEVSGPFDTMQVQAQRLKLGPVWLEVIANPDGSLRLSGSNSMIEIAGDAIVLRSARLGQLTYRRRKP